MKSIVTGGCGFIGSHIVKALLQRGDEVVVIDNLYSGFESYLPKNENLTFLKIDISNWAELSQNFAYLKGAECVFHLAAIARIQPSIYDPTITTQYNVIGTQNILQMMRMCDIPSIVYSASSSYYGKSTKYPFKEDDPPACETPYAVTKYFGEQLCKTWSKLYGIKSICLRYFNVYGRRSPLIGLYAPVVSRFFKQAISKEPITVVGDGKQFRTFTHVRDVVDANLLAMKACHKATKVHGHEVVNIGATRPYTINQVAEMVASELSEFDPKIIHVPERVGEAYGSSANIMLARNFLSWEPQMSFGSGIFDLKQYYLDNVEDVASGRRDL